MHKHRNLLAHAPKKLHDEISVDYTDMEEAGEPLFTFLRYPASQYKSLRTTNAIERFNEEFRRRIKIQCVLPCGGTVCMLFWALLASGQITLRKVNGWQTLHEKPRELELDRATWTSR